MERKARPEWRCTVRRGIQLTKESGGAMSTYAFDAVLERPEGVGTWTYLRIPLDVQTAFGSKGQAKVTGSINGHPYRGVAMPMGDGTHYLVVSKTIRDAIGAHAGATVQVIMELDTAARSVVIPAEFQQALDGNQAAHERFTALSYSHQREYIDWIQTAKKTETRGRRIQAALERLVHGEGPKSGE
jgi:Domain of unknown function (DUF1905)/Bacteriocin-protection, YdeI or OmpD-Associated